MRFPFPKNEMTAKRYQRLVAPILKMRHGCDLLRWLNGICTTVFYIVYPISLIVLIIIQDPFRFKAMLIPAASFLLLSVLRRWLNRPRPYEIPGLIPILKKRAPGASFPSRHVFSAFMIASTISVMSMWGLILFIPAILLAIIRVIGGVHYPSDVVVGIIFALLASLFYYL